jgi:dTDP-4-dehydrorhamnose 3,5-epimerase
MKEVGKILEKVLVLKLEPFEDFRGEFIEIFNEKGYPDPNIFWRQDDISISRKNVLRGIHGDNATWKLVTCLHGSFYVVVVDCDTESENYLDWDWKILNDRNHYQLLVPPRHGLAILALEEDSMLHYKQSEYYLGMEAQFTFKWNDPSIGIYWPIKDPILSERDGGKK